MKKLFRSTIFQVYLFIFLFLFINVFVIFKVDVTELFDSYVMIYFFWFLIIVLLKVISSKLSNEESKDV